MIDTDGQEQRFIETYVQKKQFEIQPNTDNGERPNSRHSDKVIAIPVGLAKTLYATQQQAKAAEVQAERFKLLLREKEIDLHTTKHENALLKQLERRHQKEAELMEQQAQDAPRIIKGLRDEISHLKQKIKTYFAQIGEDSRTIRQLDEEKRRLRECNNRLEALVNSKSLLERDVLEKKLEEIQTKLQEDLIKRNELSEKNLMNDNRQLRTKVNNLEKENTLISEQIKNAEAQLREKEKVISSLSIYRYNAIHRKNEGACKVCAKKEKEEQNEKRRQAIYEKLPTLENLNVAISSETSVLVQVTVPQKPDIEFSRITILYSVNADFIEDVSKHVIETSKSISAKLENLKNGEYYHIKAFAGYLDVEGPITETETILVDVAPVSPKIMGSVVDTANNSIKVVFEQPKCQGSAPHRYKLFNSTTPAFTEKYLVSDLDVASINMNENKQFEMIFNSPQIACPYYFKVSSINKVGESELSNCSEGVRLDFVPPMPSRPLITRQANSSILVTSSVDAFVGSPIDSFTIHLLKRNTESSFIPEKTYQVPGNSENTLKYEINDLEATASYRIQVTATNAAEASPFSDFSEIVSINELIPTLEDVKITVLSASSVMVKFPPIKFTQPVILGYKVFWSMFGSLEITSSQLIPASEKEYTIKNLKKGQSLTISACYIGQKQQGASCDTKVVDLAAGVPLPPSPEPETDTSPSSSGRNSLTGSQRSKNGNQEAPMKKSISMNYMRQTSVRDLSAVKDQKQTKNSMIRRSNQSLAEKARRPPIK